MKMLKKALSVCLAAVCLLFSVSVSISGFTASAAVGGICGDEIEWMYDESTYTLTIRGREHMDTFSEGAAPWQAYMDDIRIVVIEGKIYRISDYAFKGCGMLCQVELDDEIWEIGFETFADCICLESFNIPQSTRWIDDRAFADCNGLRDIFLPEGLEQVCANAFSGCRNLTDCHFGGDEEAWNAIEIQRGNDALADAEIHYNAVSPLCFPHMYTLKRDTLKEASCTEDGLQAYTEYCVKCGEVYSYNEYPIPAHHTPGVPEYVSIKEPTCTETGERQKTVRCTVCGKITEQKNETVPNQHTPGRTEEVVLDPGSCTSWGSGETVTYCSVCGEEISRKTHVILTLGHDFQMRYYKDANGKYYQECAKCGYRTEPVDDLPEDYCKYCYQYHVLSITRFFHNVLYFFKHLFGKA